MDKNLLRALFWALLVLLTWNLIASKIWPRPKPGTPTKQTIAPGTYSGDVTSGDATSYGLPDAGAGLVNETTSAAASDTGAAVGEGGEGGEDGKDSAGEYAALSESPQTVQLGTTNGFEESPYRMQLALSNLGASIETVKLSDDRADVKTDARYQLLAPLKQQGRTWRSLAIEKINIDGQYTVRLENVGWRVRTFDADDATVAEFTATITRSQTPVLELVRTFTLPQQAASSKRHDLRVALAIRNLTDTPINVIVTGHGPVGIVAEGSFSPDQKVFVATRPPDTVDFTALAFKKLAKKGSSKLFPEDAQNSDPLLWFGGENLYFTCTVCPLDEKGADAPGYIALVEGIDLDGAKETTEDITTRTTTARLTVDPRGQRTLNADVYVGPKDRKAFENNGNTDYIARGYMQQIKEGYGWCSFSFLTDLMIRLMNWLESVVHNFGVAIILLVVVVRGVLHPVTKKTQVNMVKMQERMGPLQQKMEALKKKHAGDTARIQQETMKLYRDEGVSPFGQVWSCLPMMLQMPIWIALYSSLRNNVAMRGRGFCFWIDDLTAPDCLIHFDKPVHLPFIGELTCFHLLPILVGIMMFAQQKLMPKARKPASATASSQAQQAEQMQKLMPYMSLVMIFIFYKFPSGLNLYIMTSSLFGALEQTYIRKHIKKNENQEYAPTPPKTPSKPRKLPTFFGKIQKMAEDAQKVQSKRSKGKK